MGGRCSETLSFLLLGSAAAPQQAVLRRALRAPIGTCGTCRNACRRRACDTPRAPRTRPPCLAAKLPLNTDRPEREDERPIKTLRHARKSMKSRKELLVERRALPTP